MSVLPPTITTAINRFDAAAQTYAFKGTMDLDRRSAVTHQYHEAKAALERAIEKAISR